MTQRRIEPAPAARGEALGAGKGAPARPGRRGLLLAALAAAVAAPGLGVRPAVAARARPLVEVWKSPTCGCCGGWVEHMQAAGFDVRIHDVGNAAARAKAGLPMQLGSCHTAIVDGYVVEGHVPAADVKRLLAERPQALGLAVPGMPIGSPGMEQGDRRDPYDVLLVARDGSTSVWKAYR
ncbi:DUF411 domain-containing protein [Burkholderiaceae bacterium FT117]|uniref:DUF411 domain-containing protein n=1 Tax=Zeimonas sediminis TaxID=2944268 RepID=UPI002342F820|nr:DUF411 domain-containing protein [Zeimonas sediminis]MCM5570672.1 DUF411 domain-containing protein [Zeimonas sediminis]